MAAEDPIPEELDAENRLVLDRKLVRSGVVEVDAPYGAVPKLSEHPYVPHPQGAIRREDVNIARTAVEAPSGEETAVVQGEAGDAPRMAFERGRGVASRPEVPHPDGMVQGTREERRFGVVEA